MILEIDKAVDGTRGIWESLKRGEKLCTEAHGGGAMGREPILDILRDS